MSILVIAEHDNIELKGATLNTVTAAKEISSEIDLLIAGSNCSSVVDKASLLDSINRVLVADKPAYKNFLAENIGSLVAEIGKNYSHILAPATTNGKNFLPRVAALLDVAQISDISSVVNEDTFERSIYAGNCVATVQSSDPLKVLTVRTTGFDACSETGGSASVEDVPIDNDLGISSFVKEELAKSDRPELTAADIVISGGRGM